MFIHLDMDRPTRALQALIEEDGQSVSGMIQQGWATSAGFELVAKMQPNAAAIPTKRGFFYSFDIMDLQQVGANMRQSTEDDAPRWKIGHVFASHIVLEEAIAVQTGDPALPPNSAVS